MGWGGARLGVEAAGGVEASWAMERSLAMRWVRALGVTSVGGRVSWVFEGRGGVERGKGDRGWKAEGEVKEIVGRDRKECGFAQKKRAEEHALNTATII